MQLPPRASHSHTSYATGLFALVLTL